MIPLWSSPATDPNPPPPSSPLKPISDYRRTFLLLTILLLQLALLSTSRLNISSTTPTAVATLLRRRAPYHSPTTFPSTSAVTTAPPANGTTTSTKPPASPSTSPSPNRNTPTPHCPHGRIYVYDLPAEFNADLVAACDDLNPWTSRCAALSNKGFGRPLGDDLLAPVVPPDLVGAWYATDQFAGELIYHARILQHPCRTLNPDDANATAFYIPFYAGLAVGKYLWSSNTADNQSSSSASSSARDRDRHCEMFLQWIRQQNPWRRSGGSDHFLMLGRITWDFRRSHDEDWGGSFLYMPGMENVTRLLIERNPWDPLDVGVPYPTGFHPRRRTKTGTHDDDVSRWQAHVLSQNRSTLFSFAGAARSGIKNDFRGLLLTQCAEAGSKCRSVDWKSAQADVNKTGSVGSVGVGGGAANRTKETLALFLDSQFCLQPRGDSFTRRSIFDCMIAGAIPVFFWRRSIQYEWFLSSPAEDWSVFIDRAAVRNGTVVISQVLEGIGPEKISKMRQRVVQLIPRLVYSLPGGDHDDADGASAPATATDDAFEVAVQGVLRRFRKKRAAAAERSQQTTRG